MNEICIIIPYFGNFPSYYQLFLNSCGKNMSIKWFIFTDNNKEYVYPENVKKIHLNFQNLVELFEKKLGFTVCLNSFHKLCDFRPAYGFLFEEYIKEFAYWGHCDMDLIWGDLEGFLSKIAMTEYDKLFDLGHLTLYRNTEEINKKFMIPHKGRPLYKDVFTSNKSYIFDEAYTNSINNIFIEQGIPICPNLKLADIYTKSSNFLLTYIDRDGNRILENKSDSIFFYDSGRLFRYTKINNILQKEEFAYIHLQKRAMNVHIPLNKEKYYIIPNSFEEAKTLINMDTWTNIKKKEFNLHYFKLRYKNFKTKFKRLILRGN